MDKLVSEVGETVTPEVEKKIEETEARMIESWDGLGEPWFLFNPDAGEVVKRGLGGLVLRLCETCYGTVTDMFRDLSPQDFEREDFEGMSRFWLQEFATDGEKEQRVSDNKRLQVDAILELWEQTEKVNAVPLLLSRTADVYKRGDDKELFIGKVLSHYHPGNSDRLSGPDRKAFTELQLAELRAVTNSRLYILRKEEPHEETRERH